MAILILLLVITLGMLLRAHQKIYDLETLLDGVVRFGPERFEAMLRKGPPPGI